MWLTVSMAQVTEHLPINMQSPEFKTPVPEKPKPKQNKETCSEHLH
jgi:hypothetical protein